MAMEFKFNRVCCLSLSKGCLLLGLFDLAVKIYLVATMLKLLFETPSVTYKFLLVMAVIGLCTNLFMMSGSILENHWSMLPHLGWEMILIIIYIVIGLILLGQRLQGDHTIDIVLVVVILSCAPTVCVYIWNVEYSRYLEIKKKNSSSSELVETENHHNPQA